MRFKIEFRPDILKFIGISSAGIFIGLLLFFFIEPMGVLGFILILGGFIGLLIALFAASKPGCDLVHDERMELNMLRASKKGFLFMLTTTGFLLALFGLRVINEILFVAFMGPVFAIASILYVWTYHRYENGADENQD